MTDQSAPPAGRVTLVCAALMLTTLIAIVPGPASARDWYVDGKYGQKYNSGTNTSPYLYFWQANTQAKPGDTIYLKPTTTYSTLYVSATGTFSKPITIAGTGGAANPTHVNGGGSGFGIWIGASHVKVAYFDVTAPRWSGIHVPEGKHHVTIRDNNIHDAGGNGIDLVGTDYMTISYNRVYNNAKYTGNGSFTSGISVKGSVNTDGNTGVKILINGNTVYGNTNVPNCSSSTCFASASDSDGSGIILDNNRRTYSDNYWYRGRILVANNVVFGNGGRGIHMYLSDHITVNGNTSYSNNRDYYEGNYRPGEVTGDYVSDVDVYNNILSSDGLESRGTGSHVPVSFMYCSGVGPITIRNNLGYRPQNDPNSFLVTKQNKVTVSSYGNYWGNPYFVNATLNASKADFRFRSYSKAYNHGLTSAAMATDILGVARRTPISIGAYENPF